MNTLTTTPHDVPTTRDEPSGLGTHRTGGARRPRACIVRQVDKVEGALVRDAEALVSVGYDVDLVIMRLPDETHGAELPDGVQVVALPVRRRRGGIVGYVLDYLRFTVPAAAVVAWRHLRHRYQLVQAVSLPDLLAVAGLMPKLGGAALVTKIAEPTPQLSESIGHPRVLSRLLGWMQLLAARMSDHVVTVTDDLAEDLVTRGVDPERVSVVLNVPPPSMASLRTGAMPDPDRFTVISHGSVLERYGHDTILRAAALVRDDVPGVRLVFTGSDDHWAVLEELIDELGIADLVEHHEWLGLPELVEQLERSDLGVVAQRANPYSHLVNTTKMFEFFMLDIPVACTRLDATERVVPPAEGTVAYFGSDDAEALAEVIRSLAADPGRRARMAERGRDLYERIGTGVQRERYLGAVRAAVERRQRSRRRVRT